MDTEKILRTEYMAQLRADADDLAASYAACRKEALGLIRGGKLMTAALYIYSRQLYLYTESVGTECAPESFLHPLAGKLSPWPQGDESVDWVRMTPVFWHAEPESADQWRLSRPRERRRGRIAYLKPDMLTEYVYHHFALTREGVFPGDKYMFISLYGTTLFSYFEEPRSSDSILNTGAPSKAIRSWLATDPDSHFIHLPGSKGQNFLLLPACFDVGESDAE